MIIHQDNHGNTDNYQPLGLYTSVETGNEKEYQYSVYQENQSFGKKICNFCFKRAPGKPMEK